MNKKILFLSLLFAIIFLNFVSAKPKIDENILSFLQKNGEVEVIVILEDEDLSKISELEIKKQIISKNQEKVLQKINLKNLKKVVKYETTNAFYAIINNESLTQLSSDVNIKEIIYDKQDYPLLIESIPIISVDDLHNKGYLGDAQTICVIDTGIDYSHPDLGGCFGDGCKVIGGYDYFDNDNDPTDDRGHGTHVAGILASENEVSKGVAPNANLVALKVCGYSDSDYTCSINAQVNALKWCIDNASKFNISVISISVGGHIKHTGYCNGDVRRENIDLAVGDNIFVSIASGNDGFKDGIIAPACIQNATSVGATFDDSWYNWPPDPFPQGLFFEECGNLENWFFTVDDIVCFTNRNNYLDLLAPGAYINSTVPTGSCELCDSSGFTITQGTSLAAPHISGIAVLLKQKNSSLTPQDIENALKLTGKMVDDPADPTRSFSRVDALAAINYVSSTHNVGDTIYGLTLPGMNYTTKLTIPQEMKVELALTFGMDDLELYLEKGGTTYAGINGRPFVRNITATLEPGDWTIKVYGKDVESFAFFTLKIIPVPDPNGPGGINFTEANLNYISTCNPEELTFVMKAEEAEQDATINITNATIQATDSFLTALVIPDHKMWITMDTKPGDGFGGKVGDVSRVDDNLAQTRLGQIMFDADVQLKLDTFGQSQSLLQGLINDWVSDVSGDPAVVPYFYARVWISPETLEVNETDNCKIFLTNLTLDVSHEVEAVWLSSGSGYTQELEDFKNNLSAGLANIAADAKIKINNHSNPDYEEMRRAFASVALAQWYKEQDRSKLPFGDLIDTSDIEGAGVNISFDQAYYESEAWQHLYTFWYSGNWWMSVYGGVELTDISTTVEGAIDSETAGLMENATKQAYVNKSTTYYYLTEKTPNKPDLEAVVVGFNSLRLEINTTINTTAVVRNTGKTASGDFNIYFYYKYTHPNGYTANYEIENLNASSLDADGIGLYNVLWNASLLGDHEIYAVVDYYDDVEEISELNNIKNNTIDIKSSYPTATITSPYDNYQVLVYNTTELEGYGLDEQDGYIDSYKLNWSSSIDGYLGNGSSLIVNLSLGEHIVTLTVTDSDGNVGNDGVEMEVS